MFINSIIDHEEGKYILLTDNGCEGISITYQSDNLEDVFMNLNQSYGSKQAIVNLVDIKFEVINAN